MVGPTMTTEIQGVADPKTRKATYAAREQRREAGEREGDETSEVADRKVTSHGVEFMSAAGSVGSWVYPGGPGGIGRMRNRTVGDKGRIPRMCAVAWEKK